mmetsp:Transcript_96779/g.191868  ORF Transcript_96779/g.191868 Transcript_96779/m.191868 type:complete len:94 (+) Transcript_96779:493-774(+)
MRYFSGIDGKCQACGTVYSRRTRLLPHLTDVRRPKCHDWCLQHGTKLSEEVVTKLDLSDRALRSEYRKAGHTNVLTLGPAQLATGSRKGGRRN